MIVEYVGERRQREVGRRRVAADEGQLEPELVEAVGSRRQSRRRVVTGERTERRLDRRHEPVDDRIDGTDVDPAPRQPLGELRGDRDGRGPAAAKSTCSSTAWTSEPTRAPPGIVAKGSGDRSQRRLHGGSVRRLDGRGSAGSRSSVIPTSSGSLATSASWRPAVRPVYDTRRHQLSSVRSNVRTSSSAPAAVAGDQRAPVPPEQRSTAMVPGALAASCFNAGNHLVLARRRRRASEPSGANSRRPSAESRLPNEVAHHTTA